MDYEAFTILPIPSFAISYFLIFIVSIFHLSGLIIPGAHAIYSSIIA